MQRFIESFLRVIRGKLRQNGNESNGFMEFTFRGFMQGALAEIDVRSILQLVELGQRTGQLWVQTLDRSRSWWVFFVQGQIVYAGDPQVGSQRLRAMLARHRPAIAWETLPQAELGRAHVIEYGYLWAVIERRWVSPEQARALLETMIRETLFELLELHQGRFVLEQGPPLSPVLMAWETLSLVATAVAAVQAWKQFYPQLQSPEQCPVIVDAPALQQALPPATAQALIQYADRGLSLRQLAYALNRDLLVVAKAIVPCIQRGWVTMKLPPLTIAGSPPLSAGDRRIVCIDDAVSVGELIVQMLTPQGYAVSPLSDPVAALSQVFGLQPQLILCDIAMPQLDGYELCAMLRQSSQFQQTPIIMLTGQDGFVDRLRANMVGATDYLAKPFSVDELITLLEQYLPPFPQGEARISPELNTPELNAPEFSAPEFSETVAASALR
jgi:twitching motility two-component system response regulator PilG